MRIMKRAMDFIISQGKKKGVSKHCNVINNVRTAEDGTQKYPLHVRQESSGFNYLHGSSQEP